MKENKQAESQKSSAQKSKQASYESAFNSKGHKPCSQLQECMQVLKQERK